MRNSRRDFVKTVGFTGMAAIGMSGISLAAGQTKDGKSGNGTTFLFQGDSITDGNRTRNNDWNHVMGHGYAYLIASRLWYDHTDKNLMFYNRGISGNRVRDLEARWQEDTIDLKPDVLSILVGVNDVHAIVNNNEAESIGQFEDRYKNILDKTREALPETKIVLCEPFILPVGWVKDNLEQWRAEIKKRQVLTKALAEKYGAIFVELQEPFNKACQKAPADYWIWDGVHPMPAGHELMARQWIKKVKKSLRWM